MTLIAILLALVGFGALGLATDAHYRRRRGLLPAPGRKRRLRRAGWTALTLSAVPAVIAAGRVFGPVLASGIVMLGAGAAFLLLNLLPSPPPFGTRDRAPRSHQG